MKNGPQHERELPDRERAGVVGVVRGPHHLEVGSGGALALAEGEL